MTHPVVDDVVTVYVPFVGAACLFDEEWERRGRPAVMADSSRQKLPGGLCRGARPGKAGRVGGMEIIAAAHRHRSPFTTASTIKANWRSERLAFCRRLSSLTRSRMRRFCSGVAS